MTTPPDPHDLLQVRPSTPDQLHAWLVATLNITVPRRPVLPSHDAPFDYLIHTFFEPAPHQPPTAAPLPNRVGQSSNPPTSPPPSPNPPDLVGQASSLPSPPSPPTSSPDPVGQPSSLPTPPSPPTSRDAVVWAARGAGKTFYAALATALDLIFKPGIQIRILGGSLDQSRRMHEHLKALFERPELHHLLDHNVPKPLTDKRVLLANGSRAETLAQSHTSVRGTRPHKLRCDEVDLFDEQVWHAAQFTTRSEWLPKGAAPTDPHAIYVHGAIEALSTFHRTDHIMSRLVNPPDCRESLVPLDNLANDQPAAEPAPHPQLDEPQQHPVSHSPWGARVFRWSVIDALERCSPPGAHVRDCNDCPIRPECLGRAKLIPEAEPGHMTIADAIRLKGRSPRDDWQTEMLCDRPRAHASGDAVLPEFDPDLHVTATPPKLRDPVVVAGMDFGLRSPTVVLFALTERPRTFEIHTPGRDRDDPHQQHNLLAPRAPVHVLAEHVAADLLLERHILAIKRHPALDRAQGLHFIAVDPAGHQRNDQTGLSPVALLAAAGLRVKTCRLPIDTGIRLLRTRLTPHPAEHQSNTDPPANPHPLLTIHPTCSTLIASMRDYHYATSSATATASPAKDGPDHAVDALRYLLTTLDAAPKTRLFDSNRPR